MTVLDFIITRLLRALRLRRVKPSSREDIARFLAAVRPVVTEHPLIRVGAGADGGYLMPDDLAGISTCFSPGVAARADFEEELAKRGIRSFMADYSVAGPPTRNPQFHFERKYVGIRNDDVFTTLESWIVRNAPAEQDMILQMDIEGDEYGVLLTTPVETLRRFRIIVVEFHELEELSESRGCERIGLAFEKLLAAFDLVHAHPNNCKPVFRYKGWEVPPVVECTFHRKDRSTCRSPADVFPHPLDRANLHYLADYPLPRCWYQRH